MFNFYIFRFRDNEPMKYLDKCPQDYDGANAIWRTLKEVFPEFKYGLEATRAKYDLSERGSFSL